MNLSTARSTKRAQEVGVRKAIGAGRGALVGQFLGESMLLAFVAVLLAVPLILFALPLLNQLTSAEVALNFSQNWVSWATVGGLVLFTGLAAGSYPAFYLSSFRPVEVLRGVIKTPSNGVGNMAVLLRKGLVVSQFVIAAALIIGAFIIQRQLDYMLHTDLGFEKNQKVVFPFHSTEGQGQVANFRDALMGLPEVASASAAAVMPGQFIFNDISLFKKGQDMNHAVVVRFSYADENYLKTLKIKLLAGRNLTMADTATGEQQGGSLVINQAALKEFGIPEQAAPGQILRSKYRDRDFAFTIVGVMQDYNYEKMGSKIGPYGITIAAPDAMSQVIADVTTQDYASFLKKAEGIWRNLLPNLPFEYSFLDEDFEKLYASEQTLSRIIGAFTLMAILISCLGLFGLSAFTAEQRTKEIGVRKVLGATTSGLVVLLSKDFLKLVCLAIVIATPLAWLGMRKWLENFAYQATIGWEVFMMTALVAVGVAFLTVSFQSIKAALSNPVKSLRSE
jgi:putative ABC transport system permease protein